MTLDARTSRLLIMLLTLTFLSLGALTVFAQNTNDKMPPLIDRELFFGNPEITSAQISPDGNYIAFIKPLSGTRNIWVKRASESFDKAKPLTNDQKRPIPSFFWSRDGKFILYVQDAGGDENFNVYAVSPTDAPAANSQVPVARNITEAKAVRAIIYGVPKSEPDAIYVGLNDRDASWHDLYKVKISTGERTLLRKNTDRISGWVFDTKDKLRLAARLDEKGNTEVLRVDASGFKPIYTCTVFESCSPVRFHKNDKQVYMQTDKGTPDLQRLVLFDTETMKEDFIEEDPKKRVDLSNAIFSDLTDELIATVYEDERARVYWKDKNFESDYKTIKAKLGDKDLNFVNSTKDERKWIVAAYGDTEPGETYLYDRDSKKLDLQYRIREKLPRAALAPMKAITYKSSDGLEIPAFLTVPKNVEAKNLPLVVNPHGGPWARDGWGYDTYAQFLANRGYAVLQMNFRGSTGYGKKFLNSGNKEWGQKMQDDITFGVKHLVSQGIVDSKRVGIMGGSYGGYATLAALAFTPDIYAAGVAIVAPSNLITLLESIPPYWEAGRIIFHERMGNPNTAEGKAQLMRQSPLNSATKIKSPLLVVQGQNDPRVKKAESDQIVIALRERGFPVEYINAPDEGHGFARPVNNMAMIAAAEKFLAKHIGGRFQETMTPEVTNRLKEITVDIKTVELAKKVDAASITVPKVSTSLKPMTANYKGTLEVSGQTIPFTVTTEVKDENGMWAITDTAQMPMGLIKDSVWLNKTDLTLSKRSVNQGPVVIDLSFKDNKATGSMSMNGNARDIALDTGGALFADGAGAYNVLAALPLTEGYTATFRNLDMQTQKTKAMQLKVVGQEKVTVPAGTFDAYKLEITSPEDGSRSMIWVAKDSRQVLKSTATLAQLGGAVISTELMP